jgi:hypothetical protein
MGAHDHPAGPLSLRRLSRVTAPMGISASREMPSVAQKRYQLCYELLRDTHVPRALDRKDSEKAHGLAMTHRESLSGFGAFRRGV